MTLVAIIATARPAARPVSEPATDRHRSGNRAARDGESAEGTGTAARV
jgi:hypothetical protein